jgi:hypothetical protein
VTFDNFPTKIFFKKLMDIYVIFHLKSTVGMEILQVLFFSYYFFNFSATFSIVNISLPSGFFFKGLLQVSFDRSYGFFSIHNNSGLMYIHSFNGTHARYLGGLFKFTCIYVTGILDCPSYFYCNLIIAVGNSSVVAGLQGAYADGGYNNTLYLYSVSGTRRTLGNYNVSSTTGTVLPNG